MAASTCQNTRFSQDQKLHLGNLSPLHSQEGLFPSSFMGLSRSLEASDSSDIYSFPGSPHPDSPKSATGRSQFAIPTDATAFCTAVDVTDMAIQQPEPSGTADERPTTPPQMTSTPNSNVQTPSRQTVAHTPERHSVDGRKGQAKGGHSRTPSSAKSHPPKSHISVSRSSSMNLQGGTGQSRRKSVAYNQFQPRPDRDLIALHRESCRLFEALGPLQGEPTDHGPQQGAECTKRPPHLNRAATEPMRDGNEQSTSYPPPTGPEPSPYTHSHGSSGSQPLPTSSTTSTNTDDNSHRDQPLSPPVVEEVHAEQASEQTPIPATIIDWTLPSTRKCEYDKIDRSNRGLRGMWRRFAPRWVQGGQQRVPFFVEGKGGKEYEGSVRRFRMDVSDDESGDNGDGDSTTVTGKRTDAPFNLRVASTWAEKGLSSNNDQDGKGKAWARPRVRRRNTKT